jgi:type VI secretion system protein ImpB
MSIKEQSVAPRERVNITYKSSTGDAVSEVELPFRTLVVGDFRGRHGETAIEERAPVSVDKDNFDSVLREQDVAIELQVPDHLSGDAERSLAVQLRVRSMADFSPEGVAAQVPAMKELLELRAALTALKGPMGNVPGFRKKLENMIADPAASARLLAELGLGGSGEDGSGA